MRPLLSHDGHARQVGANSHRLVTMAVSDRVVIALTIDPEQCAIALDDEQA
jgi:hypothetical protein